MKSIRKILVLALVVVSILAIAAPALAETLIVAPGANPRSSTYLYSGGSLAKFSITCNLNSSGDTTRVFLDSFDPTRATAANPDGIWVSRDSHNFTSGGTVTLSYTLHSYEEKVRIRTYGYQENSGNAYVYLYRVN